MNSYLMYALGTGYVVGHLVSATGVIPDIPFGRGVWSVSDIDQWERATAIKDNKLVLADIAQRQHPERLTATKAEVAQAHGLYSANRRDAYDPLPEQLDRITKALGFLRAAGVDIGEDGNQQVEHCQSVKAAFPKSSI